MGILDDANDAVRQIDPQKIAEAPHELELALARRLLPPIGLVAAVACGIVVYLDKIQSRGVVTFCFIVIGLMVFVGASIRRPRESSDLSLLAGCGVALTLSGVVLQYHRSAAVLVPLALVVPLVAGFFSRYSASVLVAPTLAAPALYAASETDAYTGNLLCAFLFCSAILSYFRWRRSGVAYIALFGVAVIAMGRGAGVLVLGLLSVAAVCGLILDIKTRHDEHSFLRQCLGQLPVATLILAALTVADLSGEDLTQTWATIFAVYQLLVASFASERRWDRVGWAMASTLVIVWTEVPSSDLTMRHGLTSLIAVLIALVSKFCKSVSSRGLTLLIALGSQAALAIWAMDPNDYERSEPHNELLFLGSLGVLNAFSLYAISADYARPSLPWWRGILRAAVADEIVKAVRVLVSWAANSPLTKVVTGVLNVAFGWIRYLANNDDEVHGKRFEPYSFALASVSGCVVVTLALSASSTVLGFEEGGDVIAQRHDWPVATAWCIWGAFLYFYGVKRRSVYPRVLGVVLHLLPCLWLTALYKNVGTKEWLANGWVIGLSLVVVGLGALRVSTPPTSAAKPNGDATESPVQ